MILRLSNSEMKQWRQDRRHWYLSTYLEYGPLLEDEPGSALSIGNFYHDALAIFYGEGTPPGDYVATVVEQDVEAQESLEDAIRKEGELVGAMARGYTEWLEEGADIDYEVQGVERMVQVALTDDIHLISKLDAPVLRKSDGARLAFEHKTCSTFDSVMATAKIDSQFLTEHLAQFLAARAGGMTNEEAYESCHGVLINMARKVKRTSTAKPPFYDRQAVTHNIHELRAHWKHCVVIGQEILAARAALDAGASHHHICPPNPTRDTTWMNPFMKVYVMLDDGSDWQAALDEMFVKRDPLARYDGAEQLVR